MLSVLLMPTKSSFNLCEHSVSLSRRLPGSRSPTTPLRPTRPLRAR
jgi:hypothetical protein